MILSRASVERLIRAAGAKRVSESATVELGEFLEEQAIAIARRAMDLAEHDNRKTIKEEDIRASKMI